MKKTYPQSSRLHLPAIAKEVAAYWKRHNTFRQAQSKSKQHRPFYEGPPGANGKPGIHHLFSRTLKDLFCRYHTMCGYHVPRKAGWDTHGLPVELGVEAQLGITKRDIGTKITIEEYNRHCREAVNRYQKEWEAITEKIGYWVDMENPYITCEKAYISTLWSVLHKLYSEGYLYKGKTIQPYSPAAGTGLSTHELNQPGCYKEVQSTAITAQFKLEGKENIYLLAWTTTPWTLPANSALAIHPDATYVEIATHNPYTGQPIHVILAEEAVARFFDKKERDKPLTPPENPNKPNPWRIVNKYHSKELVGLCYEQLIPYIQPKGEAFRIHPAPFVTTDEGTGITHIAPTFGHDDHQLAKERNIPAITYTDENGEEIPIVDRQGCFVPAITPYANQYIKPSYNPEKTEGTLPIDTQLAIQLKKENKAFKVAKHPHNYPHCWRTHKPIIYYPIDAWFIATTKVREQLLARNSEVQWQPPATGEKRFHEWLLNNQDWNLSRDRFWGTPLPIWRTEDHKEEICIQSLAHLRKEAQKAYQAGFMQAPLADDFDPHRPFVDDIILISPTGKKMYREPHVIDVWFDSGAMPYAQHAKGENHPLRRPEDFPAHFIIEGIDQTRGWFYTLHALSVLLYNEKAYERVLSTGLVLDKNGVKMSKSLGNTVDPNATIDKHGADVVRWYLVTNANPWDNLKFDPKGLSQVKRKFFDTLHNTYQFFALYANVAKYRATGQLPSVDQMETSDRWILSKLQHLIKEVKEAYEAMQPTQAGRAIQHFVVEELSNWYVRLNRKRFWRGDDEEKRVAFAILHHLLEQVTLVSAPIAPFYMDHLYQNLQQSKRPTSVHLESFPTINTTYQNTHLEKSMALAQQIVALGHRLRKQAHIKVRQPLANLFIPINGTTEEVKLLSVLDLIKAELNIHTVTYILPDADFLKRKVRPNLRVLGKRYPQDIKAITAALQALTQKEIQTIERSGRCTLELPNKTLNLTAADLLITTEDVPGYAVAQQGEVTIALDITITPELQVAGAVRELINTLQNARKEQGMAITETIDLTLTTPDKLLQRALLANWNYVQHEANAVKMSISGGKLETGGKLVLPMGTIYFSLEQFG